MRMMYRKSQNVPFTSVYMHERLSIIIHASEANVVILLFHSVGFYGHPHHVSLSDVQGQHALYRFIHARNNKTMAASFDGPFTLRKVR